MITGLYRVQVPNLRIVILNGNQFVEIYKEAHQHFNFFSPLNTFTRLDKYNIINSKMLRIFFNL